MQLEKCLIWLAEEALYEVSVHQAKERNVLLSVGTRARLQKPRQSSPSPSRLPRSLLPFFPLSLCLSLSVEADPETADVRANKLVCMSTRKTRARNRKALQLSGLVYIETERALSTCRRRDTCLSAYIKTDL